MATYYINADTGNNGNTGAENDPWETIVYGAGQLSDGDTLVCQDSVAEYSIADFGVSVNCTITGESHPPQAVFNGFNADLLIGIYGISKTVTFSKLEIYNARTNGTGGGNNIFRVGTTGNDGLSLTLEDMVIHDIILQPDNNLGHVAGFDKGNNHVIVLDNCLIYDITWRSNVSGFDDLGAIVGKASASIVSATIKNCTIYLPEIDAPKGILHNVGTTGSNDPATLTNNIIFSEAGDVYINTYGVASTYLTHTYNCYYGILSLPSLGTGEIEQDPLFVDRVNSNFNLRPGSPCVDTGVAV